MIKNKPFTLTYKAYNSLTGLYYRRGEGFSCPESFGATLVDGAELAILNYTYIGVKSELSTASKCWLAAAL
tara:strand:+ start:277 stop:489 length:213 start_codon:yes stop_codon:yes gene_type:complete